MSERFVIATVSGYTINPGHETRGNTRSQPTCSFSILDTAFCYRIVAEFNTGGNTYMGEKGSERKAHALCAELNAWADEVER